MGENERVEFDIVLSDKGQEARNVTGLNGEHVIGSNYAADKKSRKKQSKTKIFIKKKTCIKELRFHNWLE